MMRDNGKAKAAGGWHHMAARNGDVDDLTAIVYTQHDTPFFEMTQEPDSPIDDLIAQADDMITHHEHEAYIAAESLAYHSSKLERHRRLREYLRALRGDRHYD